MRMDTVFDMETNDPDDFLTLILLCGHPRVNLKAVTVMPGSTEQIGLVRKALDWFGLDIPVGANSLKVKAGCVSVWHHRAFGRIVPSDDAFPAQEVLKTSCDENTTLICGAPLKNLSLAMDAGFRAARVVIQGGFAGEGVVPTERQLEKFKGLTTCPSFNVNGNPKAVPAIQAYGGVGRRLFVSKNVCHGVYYNQIMHDAVAEARFRYRYLDIIWRGMEVYLEKNRQGKKFHDPLAACCAIDEGIGKWAEVEVYRQSGEWGSRLSPGSKTWVITGYDHERFLATLLGARSE